MDESLVRATEEALDECGWLIDADGGMRLALLKVAGQIDDAVFNEAEAREVLPLWSSYVKISESLGLSPNVRAAWERKEKAGGSSKLDGLREGAARLRAV